MNYPSKVVERGGRKRGLIWEGRMVRKTVTARKSNKKNREKRGGGRGGSGY